MTPPAIKLTYFDVEGRAEAIRLALLLSNTPFEDIRVPFPQWPEMKPTMPYGSIPVMTINDGPMIAQSKALLKMVGATYSESLFPREKLYDVECAMGLADDLQNAWNPCSSPQKEGFPEGYYQTDDGKKLTKEMREKFLGESFPKYLGYLSALIEKNEGNWLASVDGPTIADCYALPFIRGFSRGHIDHVPNNCLDSYPVIVDWIKRFCAIPAIEGRYNDGIF
jgi:prostaglandin-H2 D-isomerase / glutathione transferase